MTHRWDRDFGRGSTDGGVYRFYAVYYSAVIFSCDVHSVRTNVLDSKGNVAEEKGSDIDILNGRIVAYRRLHDSLRFAALFHSTNEDDNVALFSSSSFTYAVHRGDAIAYASVATYCDHRNNWGAKWRGKEFSQYLFISAADVYGSCTETTFAIAPRQGCKLVSIHQQVPAALGVHISCNEAHAQQLRFV